MKLFTKYLGRLVSVLSLALLASSAWAADLNSMQLNRAYALQDTQYAATDLSLALRIQYIGSAAIGSATVQVTSSGITFLNPAGTADVTVVASTGIVDYATYTTYGKLAAKINGGAAGLGSNWSCALVAVRPSQATASSCLTVFSATATHALDPEGIPVYASTSVNKMVAVALGPEWMTSSYLPGTSNASQLLNRRSTPVGSPASHIWQNELEYVSANLTFSTGASTLYVYAVKDDTDGATELLLWQQVGANSTVATTIPILPKQAPIKAPAGWRIVVQYIGSGTTSAGTLQVHGLSYVAP